MIAAQKTHYAWVVAGVTFVVILFASSVHGVFSLLIQPLMGEFGWSRSVATLPASVNILVFGVTGPYGMHGHCAGINCSGRMVRRKAGPSDRPARCRWPPGNWCSFRSTGYWCNHSPGAPPPL